MRAGKKEAINYTIYVLVIYRHVTGTNSGDLGPAWYSSQQLHELL